MSLKRIRTLLVDGDDCGVKLLVPMLHALGLDGVKVVDTAAAARKELEAHDYQLCICESDLPDMKGTELLRWIRRQPAAKRALPTLVLTRDADVRTVAAFRDAGAHLVMRKPASPQALHDRIAWVSRTPRDFVVCATYAGPDRRFKSQAPPGGVPRRATDAAIAPGAEIQDREDS